MKLQKKLLSLCLALCVAATCMIPVHSFAASGQTYYAAPDGAEGGESTISTPWSLEYAISQMSSGDTLILLDGVYHEELSIDGKTDIIIKAQNKGKAVITACDSVDSWTEDTEIPNVWKAEATGGVYYGDGNIVFRGGELMQEARWPDLPDSTDDYHALLNLNNYARVDEGETSANINDSGADVYIKDADLATFQEGALVGAYVWIPAGVAYWSYITPITAFDKASNKIIVENRFDTQGSYYPNARYNSENQIKDIYYIFGSKELLTADGEWYMDEAAGTLYMYTEGTAPTDVELRAREYTLRIDNSSGVTLDGISFRGGLPAIGSNAQNCTITNARMEAIDYRMPRAMRSTEKYRAGARGFVLGGTGNTLSNSELVNLYGEGVLLAGNRNRVVNNYIHNYNFEATYADAVQFKKSLTTEISLEDWQDYIAVDSTTGEISPNNKTIESDVYGDEHLVSHNTIWHGGRSAIGGAFRRSVISYNDIAYGNVLTRDGGPIYLENYDFDGSEIHHNFVRDSDRGEGVQIGFYMDSLCAGLVIYRNLIYGCEASTTANAHTLYTSYHNIGNLFINNTVVNTGGGVARELNYNDNSHTVFINNIFAMSSGFVEDFDVVNNVERFEGFTDSANDDYTLAPSDTRAIDRGIVVRGVTDSYEGYAPDLGAFEYGANEWVPGHDSANTAYTNEEYSLNTRIPYRNLVVNNSFEIAFDGNWTSSDGEVNTFLNRSAYNDFSSFIKGNGNAMYCKNGIKALRLDSDETVTQVVSGLKPYTEYEFGGYGMLRFADGSAAPETTDEYVTLKAVSDSGDSREVRFNSTTLPNLKINSDTVTTGALGKITITVTKSSGDLLGAIDEIRLREAFTLDEVIEDDIAVTLFAIYDDTNGEATNLTTLKKGELNIFSVEVKNSTSEVIPVTGILAIYDDNVLVEIMDMQGELDAEHTNQFYLGTVLPDSDKVSAKLFLWDNVNNCKPIIKNGYFTCK